MFEAESHVYDKSLGMAESIPEFHLWCQVAALCCAFLSQCTRCICSHGRKSRKSSGQLRRINRKSKRSRMDQSKYWSK